jgi:hypothetical protein
MAGTKGWYIDAMVEEIKSGKTTIDQVPEQHRAKVAKALDRSSRPQMERWTIGKWKHPVTARERLYVNSREIWRGVKVWFECGVADVVRIEVLGDDPRAVAEARKLAEEIATKFAGSYSAIAAVAKPPFKS